MRALPNGFITECRSEDSDYVVNLELTSTAPTCCQERVKVPFTNCCSAATEWCSFPIGWACELIAACSCGCCGADNDDAAKVDRNLKLEDSAWGQPEFGFDGFRADLGGTSGSL